MSLSADKQADVIEEFNTTSRYLDDILNINNVYYCSTFCCMLLYVHSSIAIILMGKRELIALLNLTSWCFVMVERLFLTVTRGCLQFVIVVFPDHTHLLFLHLSISIVSTKIYDKRDDFDFEIVNSPCLYGDVPRSTSYGVYI